MKVVYGLTFSMIIGGIFTPLFLMLSRRMMFGKGGTPKRDRDRGPFYPFSCLFGAIERLFFTILVALDVTGWPIAMMAWLGAKMAANRNRVPADLEDNRLMAICSLLAGLVAMLFAMAGGLIWRGTWII